MEEEIPSLLDADFVCDDAADGDCHDGGTFTPSALASQSEPSTCMRRMFLQYDLSGPANATAVYGKIDHFLVWGATCSWTKLGGSFWRGEGLAADLQADADAVKAMILSPSSRRKLASWSAELV